MSQRFSDAELAAEWWRAMYRYRTAEQISSAFGSTVSVVLREHEAATLHRFATLPHANHEESEEHRDLRTNSIIRKDYFYPPAD